jgi:hypothetical protein
MYEKALVLAPFLLFWFLRKMVLGTCVLIVELFVFAGSSWRWLEGTFWSEEN